MACRDGLLVKVLFFVMFVCSGYCYCCFCFCQCFCVICVVNQICTAERA